MNVPNVVPQTPVMETPQMPTGIPEQFTPNAVAQLGCSGCQGGAVQLAAAPAQVNVAWKIAAIVLFVGGMFGLLYFVTRPRGGSFPERP